MGNKKKKGDESSQQSGKGEGNSRSSNDGKKSYVEKQFKGNEWKCFECNFDKNFSVNTFCYKCKKPRSGNQQGTSHQQPIQQVAPQKPKVPQHAAPQKPQVPQHAAPQNPHIPQHAAPQKPQVPQHAAPQNPHIPQQAAPQNPQIPQQAAPQNPQVPQQAAPQNPQVPQQAAPQNPQIQQPAPLSVQQPKKEKERSMKEGDWKCSNCPNINWANKKVCNKCKAPKPVEVAQQPQKPLPDEISLTSSSTSSSTPKKQSKITESMEKLSISSSSSQKKIPISRKYIIESSANPKEYEGTKGKLCTLEVNYGKILFKKDKLPKQAYHYDITFEPVSPKKFLPFALRAFMAQFFPRFLYASDDRKNMYTAAKLQHEKNIIDVFTEKVKAVMGDRHMEFKITLKFASEKDLHVLLAYNRPEYQNQEKPAETVQVLDVILRSPSKKVRDTIQVGRSIYFAPNNKLDLGDGMELYYGLFQSAILGRSSIYLNVDVLHKAFPSSIHLLDYIQYYLVTNREDKFPVRLNSYQFDNLDNYLKMLSIQYQVNRNDPIKTYGFNKLIQPDKATFTDENGRHMHVADYFANVKRIKLRYPNLPYLWIGSKTRNQYVPIEFCSIPAGIATNKKCTPKCTANIIKYSATSTEKRKEKINSLLKRVNFATDPTITGFGIEVDTNFQKINGRVIDPPILTYKNVEVTPFKGTWRGEKFLIAEAAPIKWCIINCDAKTKIQPLLDLKKNIINAARNKNLTLLDMQTSEIKNVDIESRSFKVDIEKELDHRLKAGYRFVLVVVNDKNNCYARVKQAAELKVGILTQCIKGNTIYRMTNANPTMTIDNILLKINSKLNGTNQKINENYFNGFNTKAAGAMFIGADVTHPSPDQKNIPSVAGVASSYDDIGFRYCCAYRIQDPKQEMIIDLDNIIVEHLMTYKSKNGGKLPAKIMYYRDGVSDGQFNQVLSVEMSAIEIAMQRVYGPNTPKAKVTFIVVQKRHHTRFFPKDPKFTEGKFNNIVAGTVVDKDIIHPFQYQFFMASHAAIQGVTKPTKYCILINESKIPPDDLQAITYDLCHYFTRCNRSVSYPAPTYYAHLVAERGKNYIIGESLDFDNLHRENQLRTIKPAITNGAPMFFV